MLVGTAAGSGSLTPATPQLGSLGSRDQYHANRQALSLRDPVGSSAATLAFARPSRNGGQEVKFELEII